MRPTTYKRTLRRVVSLLVLVSCSQKMLEQEGVESTNAERGQVVEVTTRGESLIKQGIVVYVMHQHQIRIRFRENNQIFLSYVFLVTSCISHLCQSHFQRERRLSKPYPLSCSTRVVAASFWGDMQTGYYRGIVDNIKLTEVGPPIPLTLQELYPGWIFRLYVDGGEMKNETKQQLCEVSCSSDM